MTDTWDGRPLNPERDGWHWLRSKITGASYVEKWCADEANWRSGPALNYMHLAAEYLGPCHTPTEVAAQVEAARREEREACAEVVLRGKTVLLAGIGPVEGYPWDNAGAAAAIRARGDA